MKKLAILFNLINIIQIFGDKIDWPSKPTSYCHTHKGSVLNPKFLECAGWQHDPITSEHKWCIKFATRDGKRELTWAFRGDEPAANHNRSTPPFEFGETFQEPLFAGYNCTTLVQKANHTGSNPKYQFRDSFIIIQRPLDNSRNVTIETRLEGEGGDLKDFLLLYSKCTSVDGEFIALSDGSGKPNFGGVKALFYQEKER